MGYSVMFYAVDIPKLQATFGSNDERLLNEVMEARQADLDENDDFFEDYELAIDSRTALRELFNGNISEDDESAAALYGYVLKILCEHVGEFAGSDIYNTRILPFDSKLLSNGPPIPIPNSPDFPEIGHLTVEGIKAEQLAAANHISPSAPEFFDNMKEYTHHSLEADELMEELNAYQEILSDLADSGVGTVAFRH